MSKHRRITSKAFAPAALFVLMLFAPNAGAWAQNAAAESGSGVESVVVTAEKRQESIRDVPATVSAVTAAQLAQNGPVINTGDLLQTIPGVRFNGLQSNNLSEISIRGSGTERATGADSGVGLFVNGAYVGSSTLGGRNFRNLDFFDLDRVEVIEGPQSGLYGRNAEYGVVDVILAKPAFNDSGYVDESYTAGLDLNQLTAVVNQQLDDSVATRFSVQSDLQSGGFYKNTDTGKYYDQTNGWIARDQIRYSKGPLDVDLLVDGQYLNLPTFVNVYTVPPHAYATLPLGYYQNRFDDGHDGADGVTQQEGRVMLRADYDFGWAALTSTAMASDWTSTQTYASSIDLATEAQFQSLGEIGVYPFSQVRTQVRDRTVYEDLHLGGSSLDDRLTWLVGGEMLYQKDGTDISSSTSPCTLAVGAGICAGTPSVPLCYRPLATSKPCPAVFPAAFGTYSVTPQQYLSEAAYIAPEYKLGGGFTLGANLRYTDDHKTATEDNYLLYTTHETSRSSFKFDADRLNYTVTLSYLIPGSWGDLLYAKTGTGYRAGGVNSGVSTPVAPIPFRPTYNDEDTTSYELGVKGNLASFAYFTLDGYYSRTGDAIASITDGCTVLNVCKQASTVFNINGGTVHASGIEASVNTMFAVAGGNLGLALTGANQTATYVKLSSTYAGMPLLGSPVAENPRWTGSLTLDYTHTITAAIDGFFHLLYHTQEGGGQDTVTTAVPFDQMASIDNIDLRTGIDYKPFELAVFVQNLTDEKVALLKFQTVGVPLADRYNEPRMFGVDLNYKW